MNRRSRGFALRARLLLGLLLGSVLLSGCDFDVYALPLPGGTDVGKNPMTVTVQFEDVLDLVPKSTVKVNDVSVGQVKKIELEGYHADVTLELRNDIKLPENTIAEIRQTSLLGEKFVSLSAPDTGAEGSLSSGDVIPLERTGRNPEVEEVLGALSLILNGGGVAQLKTIAQELNKAVTGREGAVRSVLTQIDTFTSTLDTNKGKIVDAIEALNRLAVSARKQEGNIDEALEQLPSALTSINGQRKDLVRMLQALADLGDVGVRVINASKTATIDSLRQLQPVLNQIAASGDNFVKAFNVFLTYPFVDEVVGRDPQVARNLQMGDYTNLSVTLDVDLTQAGLPTNPTDILPTELDPGVLLQNVLACIASGSLGSQACLAVLGSVQALTKLKEVCQEPANKTKTVCVALNMVPGLPAVPGATAGGAPSLPSNPVSSILGGVLGGLGRAPTGPWNDAAHGGPTMAQLQAVYDPALVNLLVPQMVTTSPATPTTPTTPTTQTGGAQ